MANITNTEKIDRLTEEKKELQAKNKGLESEVKQMRTDMEEIKKMLAAQAAQPAQQAPMQTIVNTISKMDTPCSIIHLQECHPSLPNTIRVNNVTHYFNKFGERKTFRYADLQNIVAQYRNYFARGVFMLADDCDQFVAELPEDIVNMRIRERTLFSLVAADIAEFKKIINSMAQPQIVQVAMSWRVKAARKEAGYNDLEKLKFLNKKTKPVPVKGQDVSSVGLLENLISEVAKDEDE